MAFAFVQDDFGSDDASGTVLAQAFGANVTIGDLLIAVSRFEDADATCTITSTRVTGNWQQVCGGSDAAEVSGYLHWAIAESTGACTVTQTLGTARVFRRIFITEYSGGLTTAAVFGKATQKFNVGANARCGPLERLTNGEMGFAAVVEDSGTTFAAALGWTERQDDLDNQTQDFLTNGLGMLEAGWTNAATNFSVALFALFRSENLGTPPDTNLGQVGYAGSVTRPFRTRHRSY